VDNICIFSEKEPIVREILMVFSPGQPIAREILMVFSLGQPIARAILMVFSLGQSIARKTFHHLTCIIHRETLTDTPSTTYIPDEP